MSRKYVKVSAPNLYLLGEFETSSKRTSTSLDEELMKSAMGNSVVIEDNNGGNRKLSKKRSRRRIMSPH